MARYLIESRHTPEECLQALDETLARGPQELARYDWGCASGAHVGFAVVEAGSQTAVEATVPPFLRHTTQIVALNKFTPEQIRSFHEGV